MKSNVLFLGNGVNRVGKNVSTQEIFSKVDGSFHFEKDAPFSLVYEAILLKAQERGLNGNYTKDTPKQMREIENKIKKKTAEYNFGL